MFSSTFARIAALSLLLAGCGTKGPLTLPPKPGVQPPAAKTAPAPADTSKAVDQ